MSHFVTVTICRHFSFSVESSHHFDRPEAMPVTYTFLQGDLQKLDLQVDHGSDFAAWQLQWDSYRSLSGLAEQDAAKQVQALTLCFSRDTLSIVQNLGLTEEQRGNVESIISAIKRYIDGHVNEIVVTPKKNTDNVRMCVDLSHLNRYVRREQYQTSTPAQAVADIAAIKARFFTVLDAMKGYHQCPLDPDSQLLTTFITPFGRFKYLRAPYGICSISEHYDRRMAEAFVGLTGFRRVVDDIIIYDDNELEHAAHVKQFLQCCVDKQIALNPEKCKFSQTKVTFAGFTVSAEGYQVDHSITDAITEFPTPSNRTDLRSFLA